MWVEVYAFETTFLREDLSERINGSSVCLVPWVRRLDDKSCTNQIKRGKDKSRKHLGGNGE